MQFFYIPHGRNLSDADLLADLRRVATLLKKQRITADEYRRLGRFPFGATLRFRKWNTAVKKAGLVPTRHRKKQSADDILTDIRRVAKKLHVTCLTATTYYKNGRCGRSAIYRQWGNWYKAVTAAGLTTPDWYRTRTNLELFENLEHIWTTLGRQPRVGDFHPPISKISIGPYLGRFGTFHKTLKTFTQFTAKRSSSPTPAEKTRAWSKIKLHKTGRGISTRLRFDIFLRDHFRCRACGRSPATHRSVQLQVDHIKPWSRGGETVPANLQTLCQHCNNGKRARRGTTFPVRAADFHGNPTFSPRLCRGQTPAKPGGE